MRGSQLFNRRKLDGVCRSTWQGLSIFPPAATTMHLQASRYGQPHTTKTRGIGYQPMADPKLLLQILHRHAIWIQIFQRFEVDDELHRCAMDLDANHQIAQHLGSDLLCLPSEFNNSSQNKVVQGGPVLNRSYQDTGRCLRWLGYG